jgi:hypothetical protein
MKAAFGHLNEDQKRNVSVTMVLVDEALHLCQRLITQGGEAGLLYAITDDLSAPQKGNLLSRMQEMHEVPTQLDGRFALTHKVSSITREMTGELSYLWTIIEECASHRLQGYGPVDESLQAELDPRLRQLITLIQKMETILGRQTQVIKVP